MKTVGIFLYIKPPDLSVRVDAVPKVTGVEGALYTATVHQELTLGHLGKFIDHLDDLIHGKTPYIWSHSSVISYEDGLFFLRDDFEDYVAKIAPFDLVKLFCYHVVCKTTGEEQRFSVSVEVIPKADVPDPLED